MKLRLIQALNRNRLRRRMLIERARLDEMRENAKLLIAAQERAVTQAEQRFDAAIGVSAADIAHAVERRGKAALLA